MRKSRDNADLINEVIQEQVTHAEAEVLWMQLDDTEATADDVKETPSPEDRPDFFAFWHQHKPILSGPDFTYREDSLLFRV